MWRKVTAWKGDWCNVKDFFECGALFMLGNYGQLLADATPTDRKQSHNMLQPACDNNCCACADVTL